VKGCTVNRSETAAIKESLVTGTNDEARYPPKVTRGDRVKYP